MNRWQTDRLAELRRELDRTDRKLVHVLARRQHLVEEVARLKADVAAVRDPLRVRAVLENVRGAAERAGLSVAIAEPVWRLIVDRCAAHEIALLERRAAEARRELSTST